MALNESPYDLAEGKRKLYNAMGRAMGEQQGLKQGEQQGLEETSGDTGH